MYFSSHCVISVLYFAVIQQTHCEHALVMPQCHACRPSQQDPAGCCLSKQTQCQLPSGCRTSRAICCLTWPDLWHADMCRVLILSGGMVSGWGSVMKLQPWHIFLRIRVCQIYGNSTPVCSLKKLKIHLKQGGRRHSVYTSMFDELRGINSEPLISSQ